MRRYLYRMWSDMVGEVFPMSGPKRRHLLEFSIVLEHLLGSSFLMGKMLWVLSMTSMSQDVIESHRDVV
jgi:hypothetical protein